jgi:hypothetical protein
MRDNSPKIHCPYLHGDRQASAFAGVRLHMVDHDEREFRC